MDRRIALALAGVGLLAGLVLALVPTHHTYPAGATKVAGYVEEQIVSCGIVFAPKNPDVPGHGDECDAEQNRRMVYAFLVAVGGLAAGGAVVAVSRVIRRWPQPSTP